MRTTIRFVSACMALLFGCLVSLSAQETGEALKKEQEAVSGRYARFERVLTQMADIIGFDDPERAELLRRAISEGKEKGISNTLEAIALDLNGSNFGPAVEKQQAVTADLKSLLKLLQSEDRMSAVEKERERLNNLLKEVNNTIAEQRSARAKTQNSQAPSNAAPDQNRALDRANSLIDDIQDHDQKASGDSDESSSDAQPSSDKSEAEGDQNSKPSNKDSEQGREQSKDSNKEASKDSRDDDTDQSSEQNSTKENSDRKSSSQESGEQKPAKNSDGEQQDSGSESKPKSSESSPQSGQPSSNQPNQEDNEQTPGRKQLEQAQNLMQEALEQLKKQSKERAIAKQDNAISELQQAAEELERQLNQLREEEKEMILATLEARFQRLLALQTEVYESTVDLSATPRDKWLDTAVTQCRLLSQSQEELTKECSFTTSLLREDGTSVSILVAVEDIESDMNTIANRLKQTKVGSLTQSVETDVIDALKELIETTQREMQEMKDPQKQQQQQSQQQGKKPALVQLMQEIKVLRSLQTRVNKRTRRINDLFQEATPEDISDLEGQLIELANRQDRLKESAAELARRMEQQR